MTKCEKCDQGATSLTVLGEPNQEHYFCEDHAKEFTDEYYKKFVNSPRRSALIKDY